ncbi:hypothetical protein Tco_0676967, partial [Tanacetum coccineum]
AIQDAITAGTIPPKTDRQILPEVTRSTNRAHIAGVGRNLAGTPASQFQIPDLYTPQVFPDSISTPDGPSSTSPAPSSTPLGLGLVLVDFFRKNMDLQHLAAAASITGTFSDGKNRS